jgi:hypothetical protein
MMVNASTPDSPSLVSIVWRREWSTKSAGKIGRRLPLTLGTHQRADGYAGRAESPTGRSRDNFPNPIAEPDNPYVPINGPAIDDLFGLFSFSRPTLIAGICDAKPELGHQLRLLLYNPSLKTHES